MRAGEGVRVNAWRVPLAAATETTPAAADDGVMWVLLMMSTGGVVAPAAAGAVWSKNVSKSSGPMKHSTSLSFASLQYKSHHSGETLRYCWCTDLLLPPRLLLLLLT